MDNLAGEAYVCHGRPSGTTYGERKPEETVVVGEHVRPEGLNVGLQVERNRDADCWQRASNDADEASAF
jgi:hypothetical protein